MLEGMAIEVKKLIQIRSEKAQVYLQNFEESTNRKGKYSIAEVEEFCQVSNNLN